MPIIHYPSRRSLFQSMHLATLNLPPKPYSMGGIKDTSSDSLSVVLYASHPWKVKSVHLGFSDATPRDYTIGIMSGLNVVEKLNDHLWIQITNSMWQKIVVAPGFYDGDGLAIALKEALDGNPEFNDMGVTFTVNYDGDTGFFTIIPSAGQIKYIQKARVKLNEADSIAGHLFGFTESTDFAAQIVSDTPVLGLGIANPVVPISETTAATNLHHYHDDIHEMTIDQALVIESSVANLSIEYLINYEIFENR